MSTDKQQNNQDAPGVVSQTPCYAQDDISRRTRLEQDAKRLDDMASFLRSMADDDWTKMHDWQRHEKERELRTRIKCAIEMLLHNLPC